MLKKPYWTVKIGAYTFLELCSKLILLCSMCISGMTALEIIASCYSNLLFQDFTGKLYLQEPHALDYFCEGLYKRRDNFSSVVLTVREGLKQSVGGNNDINFNRA